MLNTICILDRCTIEGGSPEKRPIYIWHKAFNSISVQRPLSVYFFVPHDSHIQAGSATSAQGITRWPQNFFHHMASQPAISYQPKEKIFCVLSFFYPELLYLAHKHRWLPQKILKNTTIMIKLCSKGTFPWEKFIFGERQIIPEKWTSPQKGTSLEEKLAETNVQALQELVTGTSHWCCSSLLSCRPPPTNSLTPDTFSWNPAKPPPPPNLHIFHKNNSFGCFSLSALLHLQSMLLKTIYSK